VTEEKKERKRDRERKEK
jgi:hypothetical protein